MADANSFLEQARRDREALTKTRVESFKLPGYSTIRVRYGVLSYGKTLELTELAYAQGVGPDADLVMAAESLLEVCQGFEKFEDGEWAPWIVDGQPVKYNDKLVEALGIELPAHVQPRDIVYGLFGGLPQADRPLMTHYYEVQAWMDNAKAEASTESVGKSGKLD